MERNSDFNVNDLAAKCRSKSELYNILTREGQVYLWPMQDATRQFLRQILMGEKLYLKWEQIKVVKVPHYKGLTIHYILKFASRLINIADYIPEYEYSKEPSREWICNIINTLIPQEFKEYIDQKINERKQSILDNQNFLNYCEAWIFKAFQRLQKCIIKKKKISLSVKDTQENKATAWNRKTG